MSSFINNLPDRLRSAVIFLGGELQNEALARKLSLSSDIVVCADSGAEHAIKLGLTPQAIVGDLDSVTSDTIKYFESQNCEIIRIADQESNDFEKAFEYLLKKSEIGERLGTVFVFGMTGGRTDHTLANFSVMLRYTDLFENIVSMEMGAEHKFLTTNKNNCTIDCEIGTTISLTPFGEANGIITENLRYSLSGDGLRLGMREGLSNVATDEPVSIKINSGALLITVIQKA
jgi:thiamine pyrophosphokinase